MPAPRRDLHELNRLAWNEATRAHNSHKGDQARFFRDGGSTLFPEELELLGPLQGKRLVHLQCNAGQDTLSFARLGARVTGVDISDEAIAFASELSRAAGIPADFVRADIYDWFEAAAAAGEQFDLAFSSYGAVCWLSDLPAWGRGIAGILAPGGAFVLVEFHPVVGMYDDELRLTWPYRDPEPIHGDGVGDYVAASREGLVPCGFEEGVTGFKNPHRGAEFAHGTADVITALIEAGLVLEVFREYEYANGCRFFSCAEMREGRRFYLPAGVPAIPQMYAVRARKPAA
ncbi:MAG: methyltransferase domain-containing protein [Dehalococcoidia bacterium]|nr:methyltransferase domain-containing protein [Dehalococcoidia bacterium]